MANTALQLTGQSTPTGRIPFLRHDPVDISQPQPCIIFLHGQNKGSNVHNTTSVLSVQDSDAGLPYLANSANPTTLGILPSFNHPITGVAYSYYVLAPQLYYPIGAELTTLWNDTYVIAMLDYIKTSMPNVNRGRVYLTGYSLGCGGTVVAATNPLVNRRIASWSGFAPGYGNGSLVDLEYLSHSGLPGWLTHCAPDPVAPIGVSDTIIRRIRAAGPLIDPKFSRHQSGNHNSEYRVWDMDNDDIWDQTNGVGAGQPIIAEKDRRLPNWFQWNLLWERLSETDPYYP